MQTYKIKKDSKGRFHGEFVKYYNNVTVRTRGQYFHDKPDGYWEDYYYNGSIQNKEYYNKGLPHVLFERYNQNEDVWFLGKFKNGNRIGLWFDKSEL